MPTKDIAIAPPLPPMDLMYMAAIAERAGYECRIADYTLKTLPVEKFIGDILEFHPEYLIISVTTPTIKQDLAICSQVKKILPNITIIAKGAHFLRFNTQVLGEVSALDYIIRGEPEETLQELLAGKNLSEISGLTWRSPKGIINNADRHYQDDLDLLPLPARHLIDNSRYVRPDNGKPQAIIKVARGCPFNCFFCLATPVSGARVRMRSPENIVEEIRLCISRYSITNYLFWSDIFNSDRKWVINLCEKILESGLKFTWATNTRADTLDEEMARLMKKSGCTLVSIGIESGNEEVLRKIGKNIDLNKIRESFRIIRETGLQSFAYYIIGLPWDTQETVEDTIRLAIELDSDYANFFTATAFPGTKYFDYAIQQKLLPIEGDFLDNLYSDAYYVPTVEGIHLSKEAIVRLHDEAVRRFFFRPSYIFKSALKIRSVRELSNYLRGALGLIYKSVLAPNCK